MAETILIAEDELTNKDVFVNILRRAGYSVLDAASADEARRKWDNRKGRIHLLVANIVMPGKSGTELALELYNMDPQLKILLTSGTPKDQLRDSDLHNMARLPAASYSFLDKPFFPARLECKVKELLTGTKTRTAGDGS
jgi:CheY-like chemotaxis protein